MRRAVLLLSFLPFASLTAQDPAGAPARAAMDKLSWLEGEWVGPAWYQMGPRRTNANQMEKIYRAAGGTVLIIRGFGTAADPGAPANTAVHDAFGVLSWDPASKTYRLRSHVANGHSQETIAEVGDQKVVWGMEVPGMGRMRYTLTLTPAGDWLEIGERSTDQGATWTRFMEMTLKKVAGSFVSGAAQDPAGAQARAAMDKLAWLEGEWTGPAWYQMGPRRSNVSQVEKLYRAAGGTVLVIQGVGKAADPGAPPDMVVHDAFAVAFWDAASRGYKFRTHVGNGHSMETTAEVSDRKLVWGFDVPQMGKTRYTISLTPAGEWFEIGERSPDGAAWTKFFEMTLRKK